MSDAHPDPGGHGGHGREGSGSSAFTDVATSAADRSTGSAGAPPAVTSVRILLYSDDSATRDAVRLAVGRRPAKDVEVASWLEVATPAACVAAADAGGFDVLVLDGEASPIGGLGLAKQLKNEVFDCPPIVVLTGRPQDAWLAAWSQADLAVPHPIDPVTLARAVAELGRRTGSPSSA
jgi:DNA-binding response OmpR family regulator